MLLERDTKVNAVSSRPVLLDKEAKKYLKRYQAII